MPGIPLIEDDIDCFFEQEELGVSAIFAGEDITVIYREDYLNIEEGIVGIDNTSPYVLVRKKEVPGIKRGDPLEIQGEFFLVSQVRPADSEYYSRIFLEVV